MRYFKSILFLIFITLASCKNDEKIILKNSGVSEQSIQTTVNFVVKGISQDIKIAEETASTLIELEGVSNVELDSSNGETFVTYDVDLVNTDIIATAIKSVDSRLVIEYLNTQIEN